MRKISNTFGDTHSPLGFMAWEQLLPGMNIERRDKIVKAFQSGDIEKAKELIKTKDENIDADKKTKEIVIDAQKGVKIGMEKLATKLESAKTEIVSELSQISKNTGSIASNKMFNSNYISPQ